MAGARDELDVDDERHWFRTQYTGFERAGQVVDKLAMTAAFASAFPLLKANFPYNVVGEIGSYVIYGEGLNILLKLGRRDELYLRQLGRGHAGVGLAKEVLSGALATGFTILLINGCVYVNAEYMQDWLVSGSKTLQAVANLLFDPEPSMPIIGAAAYLNWKLWKFAGLKATEKCCLPEALPEQIVHYPTLSWYQRVLNGGINLVTAVGYTVFTFSILRYTGHTAITQNRQIEIGVGLGGFLFDNAVTNFFFTPDALRANVPKEFRIANVRESAEEGGETHPALSKPGNGLTMYYTTVYVAYYLYMAALMWALYQLVNVADRGTQLHDDNSDMMIAARLSIPMGTIRIMDLLFLKPLTVWTIDASGRAVTRLSQSIHQVFARAPAQEMQELQVKLLADARSEVESANVKGLQ